MCRTDEASVNRKEVGRCSQVNGREVGSLRQRCIVQGSGLGVLHPLVALLWMPKGWLWCAGRGGNPARVARKPGTGCPVEKTGQAAPGGGVPAAGPHLVTNPGSWTHVHCRPPTCLRPADYVSKDDPQTRIGAILGLGIAYAGRRAATSRVQLLWWPGSTCCSFGLLA